MNKWNPWRGCSYSFSGFCARCLVKNVYPEITLLDLVPPEAGKYVVVGSGGNFFQPVMSIARNECWANMKSRKHQVFLAPSIDMDIVKAGLPDDWGDGYDNVMIGAVITDQLSCDINMAKLLNIPAAGKFLWIIPETRIMPNPRLLKDEIDLIVVSGNVGTGTDLLPVDNVRSIRDVCLAQSIPFYFERWGGDILDLDSLTFGGNELDGRTYMNIDVAIEGCVSI